MNVKIQSIHFDADQKLLDFVQTKLSKVEHMFDNIIGFEVFLRLANTQAPENKIVEVRVEIPGNDLFASQQSKSFEEATDLCVDALKIQIMKTKEKMRGK